MRDALVRDIPLRAIAEATAAHYGVSVRDLVSRRRPGPIMRPRQVAHYLAADLTLLSLPQIGRLMARDHTTVLYSRDKVARQLRADAQLRAEVAAIRDALGVGERRDA